MKLFALAGVAMKGLALIKSKTWTDRGTAARAVTAFVTAALMAAGSLGIAINLDPQTTVAVGDAVAGLVTDLRANAQAAANAASAAAGAAGAPRVQASGQPPAAAAPAPTVQRPPVVDPAEKERMREAP